jgi:hypothetical protein
MDEGELRVLANRWLILLLAFSFVFRVFFWLLSFGSLVLRHHFLLLSRGAALALVLPELSGLLTGTPQCCKTLCNLVF